ncbi:hypothetical protein COBT_003849 [Conglomerata obtusa]
MNTDILGYINNCKKCKKLGGKVTQTKNNIIYTTKPNECLQVDLIGPVDIQTTNKGFFFVAIIIAQMGRNGGLKDTYANKIARRNERWSSKNTVSQRIYTVTMGRSFRIYISKKLLKSTIALGHITHPDFIKKQVVLRERISLSFRNCKC